MVPTNDSNSPRPRVLLVGDLDPPAGGLATYCRYMADGLAQRGWDVIFVDAWAIGRKPALEAVRCQLGTTPRRSLLHLPRGIRALLRNRRTALVGALAGLSWRDRLRSLAFAGYLERVVLREKPDVVHANQSGVRTLACMLAATSAGVPVVVALHGSEFAGMRLLHLRDVGRRLCDAAAAVVANSAFTASQARAGGVARPVDTVLLGVDPRRYRPGIVPTEFLTGHGLPHDKRMVLFAGALGANKGPLTLLEAFLSLPAESRDGVICVFVGPDDGQERELRLRVDAARSEGLHVLGRVPRDDLPTLYRAADIFVFPTTVYEGFGLAALEAAASGCALIASRVGAIPEVVSEGENGLLVEAGSAPSLRAALERLLRDRMLLEQLREASPRVSARFTWERTIRGTEDVLLRVTRGALQTDVRPPAEAG